MPQTVAASRPSSPLNSIAPAMAKASIEINRQHSSASPSQHVSPVSLVFETFAEMGMSDKEAAYEMAMDPAQLSRVKSGQAKLPFDAVWRLSDLWWAKFSDRVARERGLSEECERSAKAARIAELLRLLLEVA